MRECLCQAPSSRGLIESGLEDPQHLQTGHLAGTEWCSWTTHQRPVRFSQTDRQPEIQFVMTPLAFVPPQRISATAKATSCPAAMSISQTSNGSPGLCQLKKRPHVPLYSLIPFERNGGGTSNITIYGECEMAVWVRPPAVRAGAAIRRLAG